MNIEIYNVEVGQYIIEKSNIVPSPEDKNNLLLEDTYVVFLENGETMILESLPKITLEDAFFIYLENGDIMVMESMPPLISSNFTTFNGAYIETADGLIFDIVE